MKKKRNTKKWMAAFLLLSLMLQPVFSNAGSEDIDLEENESPDQSASSSEFDLNGIWSGTYIDNDVFDFVSRNISFNITNCDSQTGSFDGNAEIDNGEGGEFHFTGVINYGTMDFSLLEDEAAENSDDLSLNTFTGLVSDDCTRISGIVNSDKYEIFAVEKISEEDEAMLNEGNDTDKESSAESGESEEDEASQEDEQLEMLQSELDDKKSENEMLQSELDDNKNENEILKNILEENEIEYD